MRNVFGFTYVYIYIYIYIYVALKYIFFTVVRPIDISA